MILNLFKTSFIVLFVNIAMASSVYATTIFIVNNDGAGEGLNDPTVVSAVPGNSATTLGGQFLNVFQAAGNYWEARLDSSVTIRATTQLDSLPCSSGSATLGSAGPEFFFRDFPNAPLSNTFYSVAQANSLAGSDIDPGFDDINMTFNKNIGAPNCLSGINWWLGIDSPAPSGTISFYDTILHELAHGLGFLTGVSSLGVKFFDRDDAFMTNLFDRTINKSWPVMSNAERATSTTNNGNLVWSGTEVTANAGYLSSGTNANNVRMFAPNSFQQGSSVSHWDTALAPDELMEPTATITSDDCATVSAFKDMGWNTKVTPGELSFTNASYIGYETNGSVNISVRRNSHCDDFLIGVSVSSTDGTANMMDYSAINQTLSWAAGDTSARVISIPLIDDGFEDSGEIFTVSLSNITGNASIGAVATTTITINDEPNDDICFPIKAANGKTAVICL